MWIETDLYTKKGVHYGEDGIPDGGIQLRKNYAGIGYKYDIDRDAFIPPQRYQSWLLDENTCNWIPPIPYPNDGKRYKWNEEIVNWEEII